MLRIRIDAIGKTKNGEPYKDSMIKELRVEPIGVKAYDITSQSFRLRTNEPKDISFKRESSYDFPKFKVVIGGDYLTDTVSLNSQFE